MLALKENGNKELAKRYIRPEGPTLVVSGEFSLEEYEQVGVTLNKGERFIGFWVGDWANALFNEHGVGSMTALAPRVGYGSKTIQTYSHVSRAYDIPIRIGLVDKYSNLSYKHFHIALYKPDRLELLEMAGRENMSAGNFYSYLYPEKDRKTTLPMWRTIDDTRTYIERSYNIMSSDGISENRPQAKRLLKQAKKLVDWLEGELA